MKMWGPGRLAVPSFRALGLFWAAFLLAATVAGLGLQLAGPPEHHRTADTAAAPDPHTASEPQTPGSPHAASEPAPVRPEPPREASPPSKAEAARTAPKPGRSAPGPIAAPDPALLEPASDVPGGGMLPKIALDGRAPMAVYARPFDPASANKPLVGILVAGIGLNAADSEDAIRTLPEAVTLAVSPYAAPPPDKLQEQIRAAGHEFLLSIPMEPQGYPLNDPGRQALLTGAPDARNLRALNWSLTRVSGYAGATGALGTMRGERFAASSLQMTPIVEALAARGLLYVDPRPGAAGPPGIWGRTVDLVIDEPATRRDIDDKLAQLEQIARDRGSALGLVGAVRPVTMDRVASWASGLTQRGVALAPVSALAQPPHSETATGATR